MTIQDYLNLITSEYANQPKFTSMISYDVSPMVQVQSLLQSMIPLFDLSTPPVGNQLDIIGQWVGISRNLSIPIPGAFFTWDGESSLGWDYGSWSADPNDSEITVLPDDAYLTLILGKIAGNTWDGTTEGIYLVLGKAFPELTFLIQDYQNMSYAIAIIGFLDTITLALITGGYIPLRPEGVRITEYFIPVDTNPLFGWDLENENVSGWDTGSWAKEIPAT